MDDNSYDPDFRYASNEPTPSNWAVGGFGLENGGVSNSDTPPQTQTTTGNPIKKSSSSSSGDISGSGGSSISSGPFDSESGNPRSSTDPGDMNSSNGQCECKSLEKSVGWIKQRG